ncbi:MAG: aldo/keto reductase [bacterium]
MIIKQLDEKNIKLPAIGQGMGEYKWDESQINTLRAGIDLGMNLIDTAEEYDNGRSEEIVGKAIKGIRDNVIIATKYSPLHNSYDSVINAVEGSLRRLQTDRIDLYQMHWPNPSVSLDETLSAMEHLIKTGKVCYIGLGNMFLRELKEARNLVKSISSLQIEYNLFDRTIESEIIPFCLECNIFILAYSPLDKGRIGDGLEQIRTMNEIAKKHQKTPAQVALRWLIEKKTVVVIPKAKNIKHLKENAAAAAFDLEKEDIQMIDKAFDRQIMFIAPEKILVSLKGEGNKAVYQTIDDAKKNKMGFVPSPSVLSKSIIKENIIKPVRLVRSKDKSGKYDYALVEGRIRYWAWVIAYGNRPIPAYIRDKGLDE